MPETTRSEKLASSRPRNWRLSMASAAVALIVGIIGWYSYSAGRQDDLTTPGMLKITGVTVCPSPDIAGRDGLRLANWRAEVGKPGTIQSSVSIDPLGTSVGSVYVVVGDASTTANELSLRPDSAAIRATAQAVTERTPTGLVQMTAKMQFSATARGDLPVFVVIHYSRQESCEAPVDDYGLTAVRIGTFKAT